MGFDSATGEPTAADWLPLVECMDWSNREVSLLKSQSPHPERALAPRVFHLDLRAIERALAPRIFHLNHHAIELALVTRVFHLNHHAIELALAARVFHLNHHTFERALAPRSLLLHHLHGVLVR